MPHERGGDKRRKPQSRVWGRHSPTSFPRGAKPQNCGFWHRGRNLLCNCRRLFLSGSSVHRTDRTGLPARCVLSFSFANMTPERGFAARWLRLFPFPLKIHFKGRQLPAGRGFFKISFALVIRATGFWQPAGQRIFPFTPHTTALRNLPNGAGSFFWLHLPTTGDFRFCQMDTKKAANLFQTYCFRWPLVGG